MTHTFIFTHSKGKNPTGNDTDTDMVLLHFAVPGGQLSHALNLIISTHRQERQAPPLIVTLRLMLHTTFIFLYKFNDHPSTGIQTRMLFEELYIHCCEILFPVVKSCGDEIGYCKKWRRRVKISHWNEWWNLNCQLLMVNSKLSLLQSLQSLLLFLSFFLSITLSLYHTITLSLLSLSLYHSIHHCQSLLLSLSKTLYCLTITLPLHHYHLYTFILNVLLCYNNLPCLMQSVCLCVCQTWAYSPFSFLWICREGIMSMNM